MARTVLANTIEVFADTESRVNEVVLVGNPAQEIVEFAMNLGVDLIVAGTRGRSPAKELYLGASPAPWPIEHSARFSSSVEKPGRLGSGCANER